MGLASSSALSNVDSFILGRVSPTALAVASLTHSALLIFYAALYGMASAVGLFVARAHGANDPLKTHKFLRKGLALGVVAGCTACVLMLACLPVLRLADFPPEVMQDISGFWFFMAVSLIPYTLAMVVKHYLDATERAWLGAVLVSVPLLIHIPLSAAFVFGIQAQGGFGLIGSAIATTVSFSIGFALMLFAVRSALAANTWQDSETFGALEREGFSISLQYVA
ncbi:MAG: MATE family efflux transporter, partial [Burkholderiales bacterium]